MPLKEIFLKLFLTKYFFQVAPLELTDLEKQFNSPIHQFLAIKFSSCFLIFGD